MTETRLPTDEEVLERFSHTRGSAFDPEAARRKADKESVFYAWLREHDSKVPRADKEEAWDDVAILLDARGHRDMADLVRGSNPHRASPPSENERAYSTEGPRQSRSENAKTWKDDLIYYGLGAAAFGGATYFVLAWVVELWSRLAD